MTCGKGLRTRQRSLKSPVELGDCTEELEQVEKCMLPECRKYSSRSRGGVTGARGFREGGFRMSRANRKMKRAAVLYVRCSCESKAKFVVIKKQLKPFI